MAKKASGRGRMGKTQEVICANNHRVREEASEVDVSVTIVGTGGKGGRVLGDYGRSNPVAAMGVVYAWLCEMEAQHGEVRTAEDADEPED
jgi:hypothetical protein